MTKRIPNRIRAEILKRRYEEWKREALKSTGYFPVFTEFKDSFLLRNLSGGAVKVYLYLGLKSKTWTGETWVSLDQMASYFDCTKRTLSNWLKELQDKELIERMQLEVDGVSFTFLKPYGWIGYSEPEETGENDEHDINFDNIPSGVIIFEDDEDGG